MKWISISKAVMGREKVVYALDNKPSSLKQIQHAAQEDSLRHALGDYISGREAYRAGISYTTLRRWRSSGKLPAKKIRATWFYSRQDLVQLIKAEK